MQKGKNKVPVEDTGLLKFIMFRYLPYWPLYMILIVVTCAGAWAYLSYAPSLYEITANVLLNDEKKGADDSKIIESFDIYTSKKIVENEIEILRSRELMHEVVKKLHLYAPVYVEGRIKSQDAYLLSPVSIEVQDLDKIQEQDRVDFSFDQLKKGVIVDNKLYPVNQWVSTSYGILKFLPNEYQDSTVEGSLYFSLVQPKKVSDDLLQILDVSETNKLATVITLSIQDEIPKRGEAILNEIIKAYENATIQAKRSMIVNSIAFIEDRIKSVENEVDSIEQKVQHYKSSKGIVDLSEQGRLFLQSVGDNDRKLTEINMQISALNEVENYVVNLGRNTGILPSSLGVNDPVLSQLLQKLYESEAQYEKLKETTDIGNPMMIGLKREIESIRPNILEGIRNNRKALMASRGDLNVSNGAYNSRLQTLPQKERELVEISRMQEIKGDVYSFLVHKREELALSNENTVPDSRTIDAAEASLLPVSPNAKVIYLAAIVAALIIGIGYVSAKEHLSDKVLFRSEIERLTTIPIAAEIAKIKAKKTLLLNDPKHAAIAEQFRKLRIAIGLYGKSVQRQTILVTSSIGGEGKSFISTNLASSLALSGKKVLLIDFDLRRNKTTQTYKLNKMKGIAELLNGEVEVSNVSEIIYNTDNRNLSVLPAGKATINPTELLIYKDLDEFMSSIENKFDCIIIDAPPVDLVTDAYIIAKYCTSTLFIIRHNHTPQAMVQVLGENYKAKSFKNAAIVFNGIKPRGFFNRGYGFGYGYGYTSIYGDKAYGYQ